MKGSVLITDCDLDGAAVERSMLLPHGLEVVRGDCRNEDDVIASVASIAPVGLLVQRAPITRRVLVACTGVRVVVRYGIGLDNIDRAAAADLGIGVSSVTGYGENEVADHAMALLLSLLRGLPDWSQGAAAGRWPRRGVVADPTELNQSSLGLLGFGAIGRRVAVRAQAFGMRVLAHDPYLESKAYAASGVEFVNWERLWRSSTVVSVHLPLSDATRGVVDDSVLQLHDGPSYLINTARGPIVDRVALERALAGERLRGVGLDVWWSEPPDPDDPLLQHSKILVTPHVAWLSAGSPSRLRSMAATRLLDLPSEGETVGSQSLTT